MKRWQRTHSISNGAGRVAARGRRLVFALGLMLAMFFRGASSDFDTEGLCLPILPLGLNSLMPVPLENPLTHEKIALGRKLFFDPILSKDQTVSCASCHEPKLAFTDGRTLPVGVGAQIGRRNAPSLLNGAYGLFVFWDGRAASLEEQALLPITNPIEMGNTLGAVIDDLRESEPYVALFNAAFGSDDITPDRIGKALAGFQRSLVAANSRFDRFKYRNEEGALSPAAERGLRLFRGRARCSHCHDGELFTDHRFHNTGVSWGRLPLDLGRFEHTNHEEDKGKFKTPSLRNVARTAPYMHDGSFASLDEVLDFYSRGGEANPLLDQTLRPLNLSEQEKQDLIAFLTALTSDTLPTFYNESP